MEVLEKRMYYWNKIKRTVMWLLKYKSILMTKMRNRNQTEDLAFDRNILKGAEVVIRRQKL